MKRGAHLQHSFFLWGVPFDNFGFGGSVVLHTPADALQNFEYIICH